MLYAESAAKSRTDTPCIRGYAISLGMNPLTFQDGSGLRPDPQPQKESMEVAKLIAVCVKLSDIIVFGRGVRPLLQFDGKDVRFGVAYVNNDVRVDALGLFVPGYALGVRPHTIVFNVNVEPLEMRGKIDSQRVCDSLFLGVEFYEFSVPIKKPRDCIAHRCADLRVVTSVENWQVVQGSS